MDVTNWIALIGLIFSVSAFVYSKTAKKEVEKNEKRLQEFEIKEYNRKEEELKKALIEAKVYKDVINVYNRGLGSARNIRFYPVDDLEKCGVVLYDSNKLPYPFLHNSGCFDMKFIVAEQLHKKSIAVVKLIWDDEYANNTEREIVLNF